MPRRSSLADEIAAFANAKGRIILIGVDDDSEIVGLDRTELHNAEKAVVEICQDSVEGNELTILSIYAWSKNS